ncbi:hypothetical protein METP3_00652 [Methanosarcinales archaeon]|nr:hypothetical protein METP3_00652 [Methanosarcinales archaeon]
MTMGILRLMLALSVVIQHSHLIFGYIILNSNIAVHSFYIISGFYMALILNEKYIGQNNSYKLFISNRILRLYPVYFVVLIFTIILSLAKFILFDNFGRLSTIINSFNYINIGSILFLLLVNISIIGQDIVFFLGMDKSNGSLYFLTDVLKSDPPVFNFLLIPQAWTLSLEMMFYLIAPFIVKNKSKYLLLIISLSILIRIFLYDIGLYEGSWSLRFFPNELAFFISGTLSYKIYQYLKRYRFQNSIIYLVSIYIIFYSIMFQYIPIEYYYKMILYYISLVVSIPILFIYSKKNTIDQKIGELSYPIYISHFLIIDFLLEFSFYIRYIEYRGIFVAIVAIIGSFLLIKLIEKPVNNIRQKRLLK